MGSNIIMVCQSYDIPKPDQIIITSAPTYDESACPRYDEKKQVFEYTNRPFGLSSGQMVGQAIRSDRTVGRSARLRAQKSWSLRINFTTAGILLEAKPLLRPGQMTTFAYDHSYFLHQL